MDVGLMRILPSKRESYMRRQSLHSENVPLTRSKKIHSSEKRLMRLLLSDEREAVRNSETARFLAGLPMMECVAVVNTRFPLQNFYADYSNCTPLGFAVANHNADLVEIMLRCGADPDAIPCSLVRPRQSICTDIHTPLQFAVQLFSQTRIVKTLLEYGADTNLLEPGDDFGLLHYIATCSCLQLAAQLLTDNRDVNQVNEDGRSSLHFAAMSGTKGNVELLLARGATVSVSDHYRKTPLMYATIRDQTDVITLLVGAGASLNAADMWGRTALHYAVRKASVDAVKLLLDKGADITLKARRSLTPLDYAHVIIPTHRMLSRKPKEKEAVLLELLVLAAKEPVTQKEDQFFRAASILIDQGKSDVAVVKLLGDNEHLLHKTNRQGHTLLHKAAMAKRTEVIEWLCRHGLDVNSQDAEGWAPVHHAAMMASADTLGVLMGQGAHINSVTPAGWTPLWLLLCCGGEKTAMYYIQDGCDLDNCMTISSILKLEGRVHLPTSLFDPEEMRSNPVRYARQNQRIISPLELALHLRYCGLAYMLVVAGAAVSDNLRQHAAKLRQRHLNTSLRRGWDSTDDLLSSLDESTGVGYEDMGVITLLQALQGGVRSLRELSRVAVRAALGTRIYSKMRRVRLPPAVKRYTCLQDVEHQMDMFKRQTFF